MSIPLLIAVLFFVLISGYFIILPMYKKRPVLIKNIGLPLYAIIIFGIIGLTFSNFVYIAGILIALFFYITKMWVVFGLSKEVVTETIQKAAALTRTALEQDGRNHLLDNRSMRIRIFSLSPRANLVSFKEISPSKRADLSKEVLRKFIQNYYLS